MCFLSPHRLYKKFLPYLWSAGGDLFDSSGHLTLATPEAVAAITYYVNQQNVGMLETQKNLDDAFMRGKVGVWFSGSWMLTPLSKVGFAWHTELFPGTNGHDGLSFGGGEYIAINANSAMKNEAETFVEYLTRPDNELRFAKAVNMFPADTTSQKDAFYLNRREGPVFIKQLQLAKMTPVIPQWLDAEAVIEDEVSRALYHKETPEQASKSMQSRIEEILKQP